MNANTNPWSRAAVYTTDITGGGATPQASTLVRELPRGACIGDILCLRIDDGGDDPLPIYYWYVLGDEGRVLQMVVADHRSGRGKPKEIAEIPDEVAAQLGQPIARDQDGNALEAPRGWRNPGVVSPLDFYSGFRHLQLYVPLTPPQLEAAVAGSTQDESDRVYKGRRFRMMPGVQVALLADGTADTLLKSDPEGVIWLGDA